MHRFFVDPGILQANRITLPEATAHQVRTVLRMRPGDQIVLLDNSGWEYDVILRQVDQQQVVGEALARCQSPTEPQVHLTLYQGLMKRDKFEWVLQKGTEVGVSRFVPVVTRRSLVQSVAIKDSKLTRWRKIVMEAAEQSHRGRIPELLPPQPLAEALAGQTAVSALIPWEEAAETNVRQALSGSKPESVALFIGPEGGFDPEEIALAQQHEVKPVTLGPRILRAETAAVVAAALILHELETK